MFELLGIPPQALFGQLLLGLINGSFYALLSLGLAVIFGLLNIINFSHGAQYMMGAFVAWMGLTWLGIPYWGALVIVPLVVGATGVVIERLMISRLHHPAAIVGQEHEAQICAARKLGRNGVGEARHAELVAEQALDDQRKAEGQEQAIEVVKVVKP